MNRSQTREGKDNNLWRSIRKKIGYLYIFPTTNDVSELPTNKAKLWNTSQIGNTGRISQRMKEQDEGRGYSITGRLVQLWVDQAEKTGIALWGTLSNHSRSLSAVRATRERAKWRERQEERRGDWIQEGIDCVGTSRDENNDRVRWERADDQSFSPQKAHN